MNCSGVMSLGRGPDEGQCGCPLPKPGEGRGRRVGKRWVRASALKSETSGGDRAGAPIHEAVLVPAPRECEDVFIECTIS